MNRKKINPSESELRTSAYNWLNKADNYSVEEVPEGWLTCQQIADLKNMTLAQAEGLVRKMVDKEDWQKRSFRIRAGGAGVKKVMHYTGK